MGYADFSQFEGYGLTTASILYRLPDNRDLLQNFIWQQHDLHPDFPKLRKFLDFWTREIEGTLHSVRVGSAPLGRRGRMTHADTLLQVH